MPSAQQTELLFMDLRPSKVISEMSDTIRVNENGIWNTISTDMGPHVSYTTRKNGSNDRESDMQSGDCKENEDKLTKLTYTW